MFFLKSCDRLTFEPEIKFITWTCNYPLWTLLYILQAPCYTLHIRQLDNFQQYLTYTIDFDCVPVIC